MKRNGLPEDFAGAVFLMASKEAGFIAGAYLPVSGGIDKLTAALCFDRGQSRSNAIQNTIDVDVNHLVPLVNF